MLPGTLSKTSPALPKKLSFDEVEKMLISFSTSALQEDTTEGVYWSMARNVISKLGFVDCVIYSVNKRAQLLIPRAAHGAKNPYDNELHKPLSIPLGVGITGHVALTGKAERINDTSLDNRYIIDEKVRFSELTVPILHKNKVIGVIDCEHPNKNYFTEQHLRILSAVASICAIKLIHLEAQESIRRKENKLLKARQQMAELKIKAIRAQMNPHFVFNALNAIQHFITINDKKNALHFLSTFGKLVRLYLQHVENDIINLADEITIMEQYLKLQQLRYDGLFHYGIHYADLMHSDIKVPALITQLIIEEGVENLAKNKVAGKMNIELQLRNGEIQVTIDIEIYAHERPRSSFMQRYANEYTNWNDHINLVQKVYGHRIQTKRTKSKQNGNDHHIILITLPCL